MNDIDQNEFGLSYGHSPVAHRVICVDFDATIVPWKPINHVHKKGLRGAAKTIRAFKTAGYTVVIFTSRLSPLWLQHAGESLRSQSDYVDATLKRLNIPYDYMTSEKVPAEHYIDDKAIEFKNNWHEIAERILS